MKLYITYSTNREVKVHNITYISVFNNKLHYFDTDNWKASIVDLKDVVAFSIE